MEKSLKKQKKLSRWVDGLFTSLAAFLLLIVILNLTVPDGLIRLVGVGFYRVTSPSMEPVLMVNDYVIAQKTDVEHLEKGDVIIFHTKAQLTSVPITEAIIAIHYFGYLDGDGHLWTYSEQHASLADDDPAKYDHWGTESTPYYVDENDLLGRCTKTLHTAQTLQGVSQVFQNPWTYVVLGVSVSGACALVYIHHRKKTKKTS